MPTEEDVANQATNQQQVLVTVESHLVNVGLNSRIEMHSNAKLQNEGVAHFDSENSTHERDADIPNRNAHNDTEAERQNEETRTEPRLSKYVKRHHPVAQIIGDKDVRPMPRNRLRNDTCLLSMKEPKLVKDALEDID